MTFWHGFKLLFKGKESRQYAVPLMKLSINRSMYEKIGQRTNFNNMDDWIDYHEYHGGKIRNQGGGGNNDLCCDKCGAEW